MDDGRSGLLHYAVLFGDTQTLRVIATAKIKGLDIKHRACDGQIPIEAFDIDRLSLLQEDDATSSEYRK